MNKKSVKILIFITVLVSLAVVIVLHANRRPFMRSDDFAAAVWQSGVAVKAEVYKAALMDDVYFLKMEGVDGGRYSWIVFHPERKSVAHAVGVHRSFFGYTYTHADQGSGILLTDAKLEDNWRVEYSDEGILMANDTLRIELSKK